MPASLSAKKAAAATTGRRLDPQPSRRAVIDIGSDTVHLLVADLDAGDEEHHVLRNVEQRSQLLELGRNLAADDELGSRAISELADTLRQYVKLARREASLVAIAATEAARRAANGPAILAKLAAELGEEIHVLAPETEARLGFLGVRDCLKPAGCQLLIDSGGASTEVTITQGRELVAAASLPVGAALLAAELEGDPPSPLSWALSAMRVGAVLAQLPQMHPARAWATGGSAHHLVGLEQDGSHRSQQTLRMKDLEALTRQLLQRSSGKIGKERGQDPRRVALLPTGALILGAILQYYRLPACKVVPPGVREGILLAQSRDPLGWWYTHSRVHAHP